MQVTDFNYFLWFEILIWTQVSFWQLRLAAFLVAAHDGAFSYECFSAETHSMAGPEWELKKAFEIIAGSAPGRGVICSPAGY